MTATNLQKCMPQKVLEGWQGQNAVPRHGVLPLTGPQINSLGIHF